MRPRNSRRVWHFTGSGAPPGSGPDHARGPTRSAGGQPEYRHRHLLAEPKRGVRASRARATFYADKQCRTDPLSLNALLGRKTYDLDEWSRIVVTVKHQASQYGEPGYAQTVELVLKRRYKFDIDVSFPAGLLTRKQGESSFGNLGGISLATLAQFSFYSPTKINRLRPYKIGAGFVALNAFNLGSSSANRDLGLVILGSVYPTRREAKFTFPLYLGGGFLLGTS